METYERVIPRDFFNEAKLLKCMGVLALKILDNQIPDGIKISIEETGEPFEIRLSDEGNLSVVNYPVSINGTQVIFHTTYNSKSNYPFYAYFDYTEIEVFTDSGEFTPDFISFCNSI